MYQNLKFMVTVIWKSRLEEIVSLPALPWSVDLFTSEGIIVDSPRLAGLEASTAVTEGILCFRNF